MINKTSKLTIKWKYKDRKVLQGKALELDLESNIYGLQALYVSAGNEIQCWRIKSKPQTFRLYPKNFSAEEFISAIHLLYLWDKHRKNCKLCPMSIFTLLVIEAHKVEIKISLFFVLCVHDFAINSFYPFLPLHWRRIIWCTHLIMIFFQLSNVRLWLLLGKGQLQW